MKKENKINPKELAVGAEAEKEHTNGKPEGAKKIATDHLKEPGHEKYYTKLNKCGLIDEPKAKQLAKKYLVKESQLRYIRENVINDAPYDVTKGDQIKLIAPVEGYNVPPETVGNVLHVDAIGTIRAEFIVGGKPIIVPINPEIDQVQKIEQQPLTEAKLPQEHTAWVGRNPKLVKLLDSLKQQTGKRYIVKHVKDGIKYYIGDNGQRVAHQQTTPDFKPLPSQMVAAKYWTSDARQAISSDDQQLMIGLAQLFKKDLGIEGRNDVIEVIDRLDQKNNIRI